MAKTCPKHAQNMPKTFPEHARIIPKALPEHPQNIPSTALLPFYFLETGPQTLLSIARSRRELSGALTRALYNQI